MSKSTKYSDAELVELLQSESGRKAAVTQLYLENRKSVLRFVLKYRGSEADRDELMNEAFLVLIRAVQREKFQFQAKLSTYYIGICRRTWFNWRKKADKQAARHDSLSEGSEWGPVTESVEAELEKAEKLLMLQHCLDELGERAKQLLLLSKEVPALSWPEIASQLAYSSHQTAKNAAQRFMKRLADCVQTRWSA